MPLQYLLESSESYEGLNTARAGPHVTAGRYNGLIGQRRLDAAQIRGSLGSHSTPRRMPGKRCRVRLFSRSE